MIDRRLIVADSIRTPAGIAGNALLVDGGSVAAIGDHADLAASGLKEERYQGAVVVPGLRDAHFHPVAYAAAISGITLKSAVDFADVARRLRAGAQTHGEPVIAIRLDDESLNEGRLPTRRDLDAAVGDRPVLIHRYCGHIAIANSPALRAAGITSATPDPAGGVIDRDEIGEPTGVLRETAIDLVSTMLAAAVRIEPGEVNEAMRGLAGLGLTSIGAMTRTGEGPWATLGNEARILLDAASELPIRAFSYLIVNSAEELALYSEAMHHAGTNLVWAGLKRFGDGSLGGHTAAMHEPFADEPDQSGTLRLSEVDEVLSRVCLGMGGVVAIHAIGDRACSRVIDLFEKFVGEGVSGHRLRLEHASVLTDRDIARIGRLGIITSVQPAFMASETAWLERRIGPDRLLRTYPLASLERAGATLAGGSDCPVEPPDPWSGMALARDRAGIVPEEGLSALSAFRLFTSGGAAALGEPAPLALGSPADFLVVDRDPVTASPDEVRDTNVIDTWIGGKLVSVDRTIPTWAD